MRGMLCRRSYGRCRAATVSRRGSFHVEQKVIAAMTTTPAPAIRRGTNAHKRQKLLPPLNQSKLNSTYSPESTVRHRQARNRPIVPRERCAWKVRNTSTPGRNRNPQAWFRPPNNTNGTQTHTLRHYEESATKQSKPESTIAQIPPRAQNNPGSRRGSQPFTNKRTLGACAQKSLARQRDERGSFHVEQGAGTGRQTCMRKSGGPRPPPGMSKSVVK